MRYHVFTINYKSLIFLSLTGLFFFSSCSKKLYTEKSDTEEYYENAPRASDSKELKAFLEGGAGKYIDTGKTTPDAIIKTARKYLGVPHCMGGSSMKCTDCSGLVMAVFLEHGISLPHSSEEQARFGKVIRDRPQLRRGDLVFFIKSYKTNKYITHAGIYIGNNEFIHTSSKKGVTISSLDNTYWKDKFVFGTRLLGPVSK